jgi:hypothetical protein
MLNASDGVHAVARDALNVTVVLPVTLSRSGNNIVVSFPSLTGQTYQVQRATNLATGSWTTISGNLAGTGNTIQYTDANAIASGRAYYRMAQILP